MADVDEDTQSVHFLDELFAKGPAAGQYCLRSQDLDSRESTPGLFRRLEDPGGIGERVVAGVRKGHVSDTKAVEGSQHWRRFQLCPV